MKSSRVKLGLTLTLDVAFSQGASGLREGAFVLMSSYLEVRPLQAFEGRPSGSTDEHVDNVKSGKY